MKPYLTPNPTLAFVIEWGVLIISILLVFSPFIYLGIKKWKKHLQISWKQIFASYFLSFLIYYVWEVVIIGKLDRFVYKNYINTTWLQDAITNPGFKMIFVVVTMWPILVFYSTKLVKERLTLLDFFVSLGISTLLFCSFVILLFYLMAVALGYVGRTYF